MHAEHDLYEPRRLTYGQINRKQKNETNPMRPVSNF